MKTYIKLLTAILLFCTVFVGNLNAQTCTQTSNIPPNGTITVNGVQVTSSSTGRVASLSYGWTSCGDISVSAGGLSVGYGTGATAWSTKLTFNKPVNNLIVVIVGTGYGGNEDFHFVSNGGTISISSTKNCYTTISGNTIYSGAGGGLSTGGGIFQVTAPSAFTELTLNGAGSLGGSIVGLCEASIVEAPCNAGTISPLVNSTLTNACSSTSPSTVNLADAHTGTIPTGSVALQWWTTSTRDTGTQVTDPTAVGAGTYYAFYFDATNNCYSPVSAPVTVTINNCPEPCNAGTVQVPLSGTILTNQ